MRILTLLLLLALFVSGCANQEIKRRDNAQSARKFSMSNLAKSDVDIASELAQREALKSLKLLAEKLYRRNPQEYRNGNHDTVEVAVAHLFDELPKWPESPLAKLDWQDNFQQAFAEGYTGDRVYAFMSALTSMVMSAYNHKQEFFITDELSAQKLYNSARNVEVVVWKLSNAKKADGGKIILSNSMDGEAANLSFEREFGKLVATQDLIAILIEDRSNRAISRVFQSAASLIFLPI